jgi:hypothetical protein
MDAHLVQVHMNLAPKRAPKRGATPWLIAATALAMSIGALFVARRSCAPKPNPSAAASSDQAEVASAPIGATQSAATAAVTQATGRAPLLDRARADRIRAEMRAALLAPTAPAAEVPPGVRPSREYREMPAVDDQGQPGATAAYIRSVMHDDYIPLAKQCYETLLAKDPKRSGTVHAKFVIAGDTKSGGVVESVELQENEKSIHDPEFVMCMRESLMSVVFDAPPNGGKLSVGYPIELSPDDDPDAGTGVDAAPNRRN